MGKAWSGAAPLDPIQPWQTRLRTRVVDRGGAPLANTPIALAPPADWPGRPFLSVQTDEDGTLRDDFPVAPGRYAATVHLEGGPGRVEVEVELDLSTPRDRIVVDVPDLAPLPEVRVTAVDAATGAPLDSAVLSVQVTTEDGGSGTHLGLRIARDGTVESIRPGRARLTVRAEGYETESRWIELAQGDPLREVRFALRRTPP